MNYQEALNRYIEATNSHHFDNVEKLLDEHAIYWFSDQSCTTLDDIRRYFERAWDLIQDEVYEAKDVQWIAADQHTAVCVYTYHYRGYHQGRFVSGSGRATNVFVKRNGQWKLIHEHLSSLRHPIVGA